MSISLSSVASIEDALYEVRIAFAATFVSLLYVVGLLPVVRSS